MIWTDGSLPLSKAQQAYRGLPISGYALWEHLLEYNSIPCSPVDDRAMITMLGLDTMDKIGGNVFIFRFDDGSRLVVNPYSIEAQ